MAFSLSINENPIYSKNLDYSPTGNPVYSIIWEGWEQSHPISQFDFAEFCWHQRGFITGQYTSRVERTAEPQPQHLCPLCPKHSLHDLDRQPKHRHPTTALIHIHRQLTVSFRDIKSGKREDQSIFSRSKRNHVQHCRFTHLNVTSTFHFSFFVTEV